MKRRRRLFTARRITIISWVAYWGEIIPPKSVVIANLEVREIYGKETLRVGNYCRGDGFNCVFLVDRTGTYVNTTDQKAIRENFSVFERSDETDLYGDDRPILEALAGAA